ncbi:MAG: CHAT domain-containing protein [Cyanobacteria bacterium RM1_2_2]|nr:CHAT domain-containing protein [Cyanobacteria bacterium RM1_2_2]
MKYIFLVNFFTHWRRDFLESQFRSGFKTWLNQYRRTFCRLARCNRLASWMVIGIVTAWSVILLPFCSLASHPSQPVSTIPAPSQEATTQAEQSLLQPGIDLYEAEQYQAAVDHWQQAIARWTADGTALAQQQAAFGLSHLSLAYQQLGQWQAAEAAVQQSLHLLDASASGYQEVLAKTLNTQGRLQWHRGEIERALQTWQQATAAYQQAGDRTGVMLGLINQAHALQTLGFSVQAETQLRQVAQLLEQERDPTLKASGWRHLGHGLRRVGKLRESEQILQQSLTESALLDAATQSALWLDLGNTQRALGHKAVAIGDTKAAQQNFQAAQTSYQQAERLATSPLFARQIKLNQLSLMIETDQFTAASQLALRLNSSWNVLPLNRSSLYAQLNYARSLAKLNQISRVKPMTDREIAEILAATLQQAQSAADPTVESYALGQLGELYEQTGQWQEAQTLTERALLKAEAVQAADIRYRWEWQLGRLQEKQGNRSAALVAYQAAVESLQSVRNDLLSINTDAQFSFRDDVEPVYRGLVELLLTSIDGKPPSQANLRQSIRQINALQLAELNNFLGCNLSQTVGIDALNVDPTAAKVYPMILPHRLAVVLELPGQPLLYHQVEKPRAEILATLRQLRQDLSAADRTPEAVAGLQQAYDWLIAPFQTALSKQNPIKTLVFVLDGELRNVPMAALYDGQQYLVSQYAVAIAPRLELFQPSPRPAQLKLFLGGIGEPQTLNNRAFPKIEYLAPELEQIQQILNAKQPLLNQAFTATNLEQQLQGGSFSAVHLKTHGIFSSDPEETFIVAYQALITSRDLGRLIQLNRFGEASPIELLVLSACSTAQGDNRAVLGLAGVAVQAGARSVVSTLWEAQDLPNTQLMIRFYEALSDPAISRAEALRQAQLHLLEQGYTTPHVWATYVLVGNWL